MVFKPEKGWLIDFVTESNEIDPQPGFENERGDPRFDDHMKALKHAITYGNANDIADPFEIHKMLMGRMWPEIAGKIRTERVSVGNYECPQPDQIVDMLYDWNGHVERMFKDKFFDKKDIVNNKKTVIQLHIQFERIHPFRDGNGRTGRIVMANHALVAGVQPWITEYDKRYDYYNLFN